MKKQFVLLLILLLAFTSLAYSEEDRPKPKTVKLIRVRDNKAISTATIISKIKTKTGENFSQEVLNDDLKRLYALGYFADVSIDVEDYEDGLAVTFIVEEKPLVGELKFTGNAQIRASKLAAKMVIKPGELLDENQLRKDIEEIKKLYESRGFFKVGVDYRTQINEYENTAKVTIVVDEREKIKIKKIYVEGNESFSDKEILKLISTRPDTLFTSGIFKNDTFDEDLEKVGNFYHNKGYLDAALEGEFEYSPDKKHMYITLVINEGKIYHVGEISVAGNEIISSDDLGDVLEMAEGEPFSDNGMRIDLAHMQELYYNKGYILSRIMPEPLLDEATGRINIVYNIEENELVYVNRVNIRGNTKTKDIVIRRELRILPGEPFDGSKIRRSKERLNNLGFFEEVSLNTEDADEANKKDLVVNVKETKTGEFSFGGGYSSIDRFIGFASISQRNFDLFKFPTFTGDGQYLNIKAELGMVRNNFVLSWTEPWILDYPLSFGFDLYRRSHGRERSVGYGYEETRMGGDVRFGKELTEQFRSDLIYKLEEVEISNISEEATSALKREEGDNILSTLGLYLTFDTRDNIFNPTSGVLVTGGAEEAGGPFLGDIDFFKYITSASTYFNWLNKKLVLSLSGRAGFVNDYGDSDHVPVYERFYAGGASSIRGYRERSVSPLDPVTSDPVGGESMIVGNVELTFPIFQDILKGAIFYDVGNVWDEIDDFGFDDYKHGVGMGARVRTPVGPVKVDWGYPLNEVTGQEQKGRFYFSMSREF